VEKFTQIRREKSQNSDVIKTNHRLRKLSVWSLGKAEELGIAFFFSFCFLYLLLGILNFLNLFGFDNINTTITFYTYTRLCSCGTYLKFFFPIKKYSFGEFGLGCVLINSPPVTFVFQYLFVLKKY